MFARRLPDQGPGSRRSEWRPQPRQAPECEVWPAAFFAAARDGDFDRLVAVLDPEVVLRSDFGRRHPASPHSSAAPTQSRRSR